jgi:hypothetical protein
MTAVWNQRHQHRDHFSIEDVLLCDIILSSHTLKEEKATSHLGDTVCRFLLRAHV